MFQISARLLLTHMSYVDFLQSVWNDKESYVLAIICFHLRVDCADQSTITKMENLAIKFLKKRNQLLRSASRGILCYPGLCSPSISIKHCKLSLLANMFPNLFPNQVILLFQELAFQPDFEYGMLQLNYKHHKALFRAREQLTLKSARNY